MSAWTTGRCKANSIDVHYLRTGGEKPPLLLLHGLMTSGACFTPVAKALEKEFDVIMPDARGHGGSSAPEHGYAYENLAADVLGLIDVLGLDKPVLIGHSMGGMTAAVVASQNPHHLRGLVLADPTFLTPQRQREVYESDVARQHRRVLGQPKETLIAKMQARPNPRPQEIIEIFAQARFQTSVHAFEVLKPPSPDYTHLIKTIGISTLLVIGDDEPVVSWEMASEFSELNPHIKVAQIADAGHAVPFDQPERFSEVVQTFLQSFSS